MPDDAPESKHHWHYLPSALTFRCQRCGLLHPFEDDSSIMVLPNTPCVREDNDGKN